MCLVVFLVPNKIFGWLQYFGSMVKVFLFLFIVVISLAIIGGAGPDGYVRNGDTWTEFPAFKNGFGVRNTDFVKDQNRMLMGCDRALPVPLFSVSGPLEIKSSSASWEARPNHLAGRWHTQPT